MSVVRLNWAAAEVVDGKLAVDLVGEVPSGWKRSFEETVRLLGGGDWGEIRCKKRTLRVKSVLPGDEEKLRHFLESAVEQANAMHLPDDAPHPDAGQVPEDSEQEDGPDALMTSRFRSFADG